MAVILVVGYAAVKLWSVTQRTRAGLTAEPLSLVAIKVGALAVGSALVVYLLNSDRALNSGQGPVRQPGRQAGQGHRAAARGRPVDRAADRSASSSS